MELSREIRAILQRKRQELKPSISRGPENPLSLKPKGKKRVLVPIQGYNIRNEL